ncbi:MAG: Acyl-CoA reductase-like NAD-dependent aldehyde dehydrogenase, partial [Cryobacterium sp.]|nr:Acyl-CoA reductase-like NAD-dependent aldehyde dehydrogenase [Cryobacterium sp.]
NGLEAYHAYTRPQSLIINTSDSDFDWFATVDDLRYS